MSKAERNILIVGYLFLFIPWWPFVLLGFILCGYIVGSILWGLVHR